MDDTIETLSRKMAAAAEALDFEEARRCRDAISLMRGGASAAEAKAADLSGVERSRPGAMGLGTSQQRMTPPPGWTPPTKPDPMTAAPGEAGQAGRVVRVWVRRCWRCASVALSNTKVH